MKKNKYFISPAWKNDYPNLKCGFTLPEAGNMTLARESLSSGKSTVQNRKDFCDIINFNLQDWFVPHLIHSSIVIDVKREMTGQGVFSLDDAVDGDGVVTSEKNVLLMTTFADCIPILLFDPVKEVIASVHSGWKGTNKNIIYNTLKVMESKGSKVEDLLVAIGPGIKGCCYNVGFDFYDYFADNIYTNCFEEKNGILYFNLSKAVYNQLISYGMESKNIDYFDNCTCCSNEPQFFSCRKDKDLFEAQGAFVALV